ncbi:karyopherin (importin) beta 3 [Anaeramoeba ignava]|uniref:Karyopherin (Importin) beta 3 n=1 Tax=Anaeramoeba ignava TaxID=1746090 RepID=A0A9Q0LLW0_ANAIG|nr:karyopherin (importin) beta 3 [Anaeramoeba ignava]|eukprot:Anaeramoba_ignava/c21520_g5_i1.p1 GENE.c21520_g5_i1~~c21520_g5_i1.p1  ORF type:complete len:1096 (-),score=318.22 c21520_g5_i1:63-3350(-)
MDQNEAQLFEEILINILSPNNFLRGEAEEKYKSLLENNSELCLFSLIDRLENSNQQKVKDLSMILLRQSVIHNFLDGEKLFNLIPKESQELIKKKLLENIMIQTTKSTQKKVCDVIAAIGANQTKEDRWPELIPYLMKIFQDSQDSVKENIFYIIEQLSICSGPIVDKYDVDFFPLFEEFMKSQYSVGIRVANFKAISSFIILIPKSARIKYQNLIPSMFELLQECINLGDFDICEQIIQELIDSAELIPKFFLPHISTVVDYVISITTLNDIDESIRRLALEFLITITQKGKPMIKGIPNFLERIIPITLEIMTDIEDDDNWQNSFKNETEVSNIDVGESFLDRLSLSLGGEKVVPIAFPHISTLLDSNDWKHNYAGLYAISSIGEGSKETIREHLESVINKIIPFFQHENPRIRFVASTTIAQMSIDFEPYIQNDYHDLIIPAIFQVLQDSDFPVLQARGATTLINFSTNCPTDILEPYAEDLLKKLVELLQIDQIIVQQEVVTAIASIANSCTNIFTIYYDELMKYLKSILINATDEKYLVLRGKTFECVSFIALAVGKEIFIKDAFEILNLMVETEKNISKEDPQLDYFVHSYTNISQVLKQSFAPYLENILPKILEQAGQAIDQYFLDEIDEDDDIDFDDFTVVVSVDKQFGIKTSILEEKASAISLLYNFASEVEEEYFPFVETTYQTVSPMLDFTVDSNIRTLSTVCITELAKCVIAAFEAKSPNADRQYVNNFVALVCDRFCEILKKENQTIVIAEIIDGIGQIFQTAKGIVDSARITQVFEILPFVLEASYKRQLNIEQETQNEDSEDDDYEDDDVETQMKKKETIEKEINLNILDIITQSFLFHKDTFLGFFDAKIYEYYRGLSESQNNFHIHLSICVFVDIVETGDLNAFANYWQHFGPIVLNSISSEDPQLRQSSVYSAGACAKFGADLFAPSAPQFLQALADVIQAQDSREEPFATATDNAIGAFGKICFFQPQNIPLQNSLNLWLSFLPVQNDPDESVATYSLLCDFIEQKSSLVFGRNNKNVPHVLAIIAQVIDTDLVDKVVAQRMTKIVTSIKSTFGQKFNTFLRMIKPRKLANRLTKF